MTTVEIEPETSSKPLIWTIAASDSSGCAGIQADIRTSHALGVHACSVITAVTAQNHQQVLHVQPTTATNLHMQLLSLRNGLHPAAIKIGVLPDMTAINAVINALQDMQEQRPLTIFDPVIQSSSGHQLINSAGLQAIKALYPYIDLLTPNHAEAALLSGVEISNNASIVDCANTLLAQGIKAVLIKGGHAQGDICHDFFATTNTSFWLSKPRLANANSRATGCTLSTAIAAFSSHGKSLIDAVTLASAYIHQGLRLAKPIGSAVQTGPVEATHWPTQFEDFPLISTNATPPGIRPPAFPACHYPLGLYPVVDSLEWLERLLDWGVTTLQLRIKQYPSSDLYPILQQAITLGKAYQAQVFINDYWREAIELGAYGVHLGQEDLDSADLASIHEAGLRLGISTHSEFEWVRAMSVNPSYIAIGAVYPTQTKPVHVVGLHNLDSWNGILQTHIPVVAIGGITLDRLQPILATGIQSVAVVTAITHADNPRQTVDQFIQTLSRSYQAL